MIAPRPISEINHRDTEFAHQVFGTKDPFTGKLFLPLDHSNEAVELAAIEPSPQTTTSAPPKPPATPKSKIMTALHAAVATVALSCLISGDQTASPKPATVTEVTSNDHNTWLNELHNLNTKVIDKRIDLTEADRSLLKKLREHILTNHDRLELSILRDLDNGKRFILLGNLKQYYEAISFHLPNLKAAGLDFIAVPVFGHDDVCAKYEEAIATGNRQEIQKAFGNQQELAELVYAAVQEGIQIIPTQYQVKKEHDLSLDRPGQSVPIFGQTIARYVDYRKEGVFDKIPADASKGLFLGANKADLSSTSSRTNLKVPLKAHLEQQFGPSTTASYQTVHTYHPTRTAEPSDPLGEEVPSYRVFFREAPYQPVIIPNPNREGPDYLAITEATY